ncbi:MAG TPA: carboxypeptidase-like regulatory domain-containing protein, partial [Blastocatellia bacterium]|nr:carboxypeptidase-like regulatory domain-containing protein [Blastocatellia bacterium]
MNKLKATLVIIAVTMAFQSHAAAQSLKIEGVVLDQNGAPVSGADATLADKSGTEALTIATNAEGRFAFDAGGDPVTLTIRARGFAPFSRTLRASDPDVTNLSITLTPAPLSE